jgi:hypothetical protein
MREAWIAETGEIFYDRDECLKHEAKTKMTMFDLAGEPTDDMTKAYFVHFASKEAKALFCKVCSEDCGIHHLTETEELTFYFDVDVMSWYPASKVFQQARQIENLLFENSIELLADNFTGVCDNLIYSGCITKDEEKILASVECYLNQQAKN